MIGNLGKDELYGGAQSDLMWGDLPSFGSDSLAEGLLLQLQALLLQGINPEVMLELMESATISPETILAKLEELGTEFPEVNGVVSQLSVIGSTGLAWGEELDSSLKVLGDSSVILSNFNDKMIGNDGEDIMFGGLGNDKMYGGKDNDIIVGQQGADKMWGQMGDDQLEGGRGPDKYYGGLGNDIYDLRITDSSGNFVDDNDIDIIYYRKDDFAADPSTEKVYGFTSGIDKIDIRENMTFTTGASPNIAILGYKGKTIALEHDSADFVWTASDFI